MPIASPTGQRSLARTTAGMALLAGLMATLGGAAPSAEAAIVCCNATDSTPASGRSTELVFVAWDMDLVAGPKVSFVKDLGLSMGDFLDAQQASGDHRYFWLGGNSDPVWQSFLDARPDGSNRVNMAKAQWAVLAFDTKGDLNPGALNLYTTVQQGVSGDPTVVLGLSDMQGGYLQAAAASNEFWLSLVNQRGNHVTQANGSALITIAMTGAFPFGEGQPGDQFGNFNYNSNLGRSIGNLVGQSSWFYAVTSSDAEFGDSKVAINEFENATHDGYWGFAAGTDPAHPGEYLLSYTLDAVTSATEQSRGVLFGNTFAGLAGTLSLNSPKGKASDLLGLTEAFLRGLANPSTVANGLPTAAPLQVAVSAVPEPGHTSLLWAGLAGLAMVAVQRRRAGTARP